MPQRACGGVAGIGERLFPQGGLAFVQSQKIRLAHIDFAPHLQNPGGIGDAFRNLVHGQQVAGDVLAHLAVAAGDALLETTVHIAQRNGQAVDLGFRHQVDGGILVKPQESPDPTHEIPHILVVEGIVQRQHGNPVAHLAEPVRRRVPHPPRRRIRANQIGETVLDLAIAAHQLIVGGIGNHRRRQGVIGPVVAGDLLGQTIQLHLGLNLGQVFDGDDIGNHCGTPCGMTR